MARRPRKQHPHRIEHISVPAGTRNVWLEYNRLSDDRDEDSVSIEHQHQEIADHAAKRGYTIAARYWDLETGKDPNRIAFRAMIDDARSGRYAGVLFYSSDRLYRGLVGAGPVITLHAELPDLQWESARDTFNVEHLGIWATMSGMELDAIRRRTMDQRQRRARNGEAMAGQYPYWIDRDPETKKPVINWRRAAYIMRALRMYRDGVKTADIMRWLRHNAPPHPRKRNVTWSNQVLYDAMKHPAIYGVLPYSWRETQRNWINGAWQQRTVRNDEKRIDNAIPALIHRDELDRANCLLNGGCPRDKRLTAEALGDLRQQRLLHMARPPVDAGQPYPLRGRLYCLGCGGTMWVHTIRLRRKDGQMIQRGTPVFSVACDRMSHASTRERLGLNPCRCTSTVGGKKLWAATRAQIMAAINDPAIISDQARERLAPAHRNVDAQADAARLVELEQRAARAKADKLQAYRDLRTSVIDKGTHDVFRDEADVIIREAEAAQLSILKRAKSVDVADRAATQIHAVLTELHTLDLGKITDRDWADIVPRLVERVEVDWNNQPHIVFYLPDTDSL